MSDTPLPYKNIMEFLHFGVSTVLLDTALDCSICREPLKVTPIPPNFHNSVPWIRAHFTAVSAATAAPPIASDDTLAPEPAVRIEPCSHIFGRTCLETWFQTGSSNRCPMCNLALFGNTIVVPLRYPRYQERIEFAKWIEEECEDPETAAEVRDKLMTDWVMLLMQETTMGSAVEFYAQQGIEIKCEYYDSGSDDDDEDEDEEEGDEAEESEDDNGDNGEMDYPDEEKRHEGFDDTIDAEGETGDEYDDHELIGEYEETEDEGIFSSAMELD